MSKRIGIRIAVLAVVLAVGVGVFLVWGPGHRAHQPAHQNPLWSQYISAHTSGLVSRKANIRVQFVNDVIPKDQVGQSAKELLDITPSVDGSVQFSSRREIVVVPKKGLKADTDYQVRVRARQLMQVPEKLGDYEFAFHVIRQELDVSVDGLEADPKDDKQMVLKGTVATADVADPDPMEKVLTASYNGGSLPVKWTHGTDGKLHNFEVDGIKRAKAQGKLVLKWDGGAIDASSSGKREVEIPALNVFKVTDIKPIQDKEQYIVVYFSDNVDKRQNIRGLVDVNQRGFTTSVDGNIIRIYPKQKFVGKINVTLAPGIRNSRGERLNMRVKKVVAFSSQKPQVRFVGKGVILPANKVLSIPFEAINVKSVQVTAFRIYDNNIGRFLQANTLDGSDELGRVGRYQWRKTISLPVTTSDKWNRYSLDATQLLHDNPGGMFRLTISINRGNSSYSCTEDENKVPVVKEAPLSNNEDLNVSEKSGWDFADSYYNQDSDSYNWADRDNPCKDAYYQYGTGVKAERNFLASNIGLLVKSDRTDVLHIVATNLRTADPYKGVKIRIMNFQDQVMKEVTTGSDGFATAQLDGTPFYLEAQKGEEKGYLKLSKGTALPTSHFDVGGDTVQAGVKGAIYGERGVWRPGDDIYLTFVLEDKSGNLPLDHPVTMRLFNPQGQLVQTLTNTTPTDGFYTFKMKTAEDAPTGNWLAKAQLGGSIFSKQLRIETVKPNRLKVQLDFGKKALYQSDMPVKGKVFGQWLQGATAANLRTDVQVRLRSVRTHFTRFADYIYDDPAREFHGESQTIFQGQLDNQGYATFQSDLKDGAGAPGFLEADFTTRVFEEGGAFSINNMSIPFHAYKNYVGIKLPKGDPTRGMLLTDHKHTVSIATLNDHGEPVSLKHVQVSLYKISWRWWWDKSGESLAKFASADSTNLISQGTVSTHDGRGSWDFEVKYPQWGRYLVRACDLDGYHCTGKVLYIDWPGWAGRAQEQSGPGADVLNFFSDKQQYTVGDTAVIQLPKASQGRALVTVENGTRVLKEWWLTLDGKKSKFNLPLTSAMSPNVYVSITLIQPHEGKKNDRPIRLYGVIPLKVSDPATHLTPTIKTASEWAPESKVSVQVAEAHGHAMTYTLAVVDEGLLGLTGYTAPDLHGQFYRKEALGVTTWDLFDYVAGAYGGELERLLALGGDEEAPSATPKQQNQRRFPPIVRFFGPFKLKPGETRKQNFTLPQYVGALRVMVVAGHKGAYGSAETSVPVKESLAVLPTLPRVIGPDEDLTVPVSVFVQDPGIRNVSLAANSDKYVEVVAPGKVTLHFDKPGEKIAFLRMHVRGRLGKANIGFTASSGKHHTHADVSIDVRSPNPSTVEYLSKAIAPGDQWKTQVQPHGLPGTNKVSFEMSSVPPLHLERRLDYLIQYPHGCLEQTTSSVFPQLYLGNLVELSASEKKKVENNIAAGIDRLHQFQVPSGGFVYWPGGFAGGVDGINPWANNYAGHFLIEAKKRGYYVPPVMLASWVGYQQSQARSWSGSGSEAQSIQAYRLYTLALAGQPELGAMNRLREDGHLFSNSRWYLAMAYKLAGVPDVGQDLVKPDDVHYVTWNEPGPTFGSRLRDEAIALDGMMTLGLLDRTQDVSQQISDALASENWYSTHSVAYALLAMSQFVGTEGDQAIGFDSTVGGKPSIMVSSNKPIFKSDLPDFPDSGDPVTIHNTGKRLLYAAVVIRGVPKAGQEKAEESGLTLKVAYSDSQGHSVDVSHMTQGTDFVADVAVTNTSGRKLENVALTQIVPSGWEIRNDRMAGGSAADNDKIDYRDVRDDRVLTYFGLNTGQSKSFRVRLNAAYLGKFYLPGVSVEAMYDASKHARVMGRHVSVVKRGP